MIRKAFSTTLDPNTLKALKMLAVKQERPLNKVLEDAAQYYLATQADRDPDVQFFVKRAKEPLEDPGAAIERRIAHLKRRRA